MLAPRGRRLWLDRCPPPRRTPPPIRTPRLWPPLFPACRCRTGLAAVLPDRLCRDAAFPALRRQWPLPHRKRSFLSQLRPDLRFLAIRGPQGRSPCRGAWPPVLRRDRPARSRPLHRPQHDSGKPDLPRVMQRSHGLCRPIAGSRPFPSLAVGHVLSQDDVQPFGQRLIHPGWPPLATRGVIPILFEQIEDAERVHDLLLNGAYATARNGG